VYWAHGAGAHAAAGDEERARRFADAALGHLAPIYRRTLELHHSTASVAVRERTLNALHRTYERLGDRRGVARIDRLSVLWDELEDATARRDAGLLLTIKARYGADREWEREQVQIALARTLCRRDGWERAAAEYAELIALLERVRPDGIIQHSLHAKHARALRNMGRRHEALEAAARGELMDPLSASVRRELGKAHFALRQLDEALDAWRQTLWLTPNDPYLHWKVAFCHWSVAQDRRDDDARREALLEAAAGFEQAATLFGVASAEGWAWSQLWAGRVRTELGQHDAAFRHLRSAAASEKTEAAGALLLGELFESLEDDNAARVQLERARTAVARLECPLADAEWGETLTVCELEARAAAGLSRLAEVGGEPPELMQAA
jgi:tetratricopeptide (TPR) repeat protein